MGFIERLMPGCIDSDTILRSDVLACLNHSEDKVLARSRGAEGGSLTLRVDDIGLWYEFDCPNTAAGNELLELLQRNDINQSSFGFYLDTSNPENQRIYKGEDGVVRRDIYRIEELTDVSPVFHPAYRTTSVAKRCVSELLTPDEQKALEAFFDKEEEEKRSEENDTIEVTEPIKEEVSETITDEKPVEVSEPIEQKVSETIEEEVSEVVEEKVSETITDEKPADVSETNEQQVSEPTEQQVEESVSETSSVQVSETIEEPVNNNDMTEEPQERSLEATENNTKISINRNMKNDFSLIKALRSVAFGERCDEVTEAVLNAGNEEFRSCGRGEVNANSIYLPSETRAITVGGLDDPSDVIQTEYQSLLQPLFASKVFLKNAKKLTGLRGDIKYPIISKTNPGCAWEGEVTENSLSTNSFSSKTFSPKRISASVIISRQFLLQDSIGAEKAIRDLLLESLSQKLEATFMSADAGTSTKPAGLFYGIDSDTVADFSGIAELEAKALSANVNLDALKYVVDPKAWASLRSGATFTYNEGKGKTTRNVLEGSEIDGRPYEISNFMDAKTLALVNWDEIILCQWGGLSIEVDASSIQMSRQASVGLTVNAWFDMGKLRDESVFLAELGASNNIDPLDTSVGI